MRRLAAFALIALLSACGEQPMGASEPAAPPADAPASAPTGPDFSGDFDLIGTEPFWGVKIRADRLTLSRAGQADVAAANPGPKVEGETAVWAMGAIRLILTPGQCSDGMSDRVYGFAAQAEVGHETLKGCAARPADLQAQPKP
ncbi:MAG: hypothetical protein JWP92_1574 [Caulobacter sp.]|nr:hypothetical protein [Caulobacter sp.]